MNTMINFAGLVTATLLAAAAALGLDWLLLRAAFQLMRPATAQRIKDCSGLSRGTRQLTRAFGSHR
jgi:hypothetical protein